MNSGTGKGRAGRQGRSGQIDTTTTTAEAEAEAATVPALTNTQQLLKLRRERAKEGIPDCAKLTQNEIALALRLHHEEKSQVEIAQILGCSQPTICKLLERFRDTTIDAGYIVRSGLADGAKRMMKSAPAAVMLEILRDSRVLTKQAPDAGKGQGVTVIIGASSADVQVNIS